MKIEAKEIGKKLFETVVKEGLSTDYCYSVDFYKWSKEMAINRAKKQYDGNLLEEIIKTIKKIPK